MTFKTVEKRGGMRKIIKKKPNGSDNSLVYKEGKSLGIFDKKLLEKRLLICTDFGPDDIVAMIMLTAWIKINEKYLDSRSTFPIYGFIVSKTENVNIKIQRAREFLTLIANLLLWNDSEHHLYKGYISAGQRICPVGNSDFELKNEKELVKGELNDWEGQTPNVFFEELLKVKSTNLFMIYLKPIDFINELNPDIINYLKSVNSVICGNNDVLENSLCCNASKLLQNVKMNGITSPKLYSDLENLIDDNEEHSFLNVFKKVMYMKNDELLNETIECLKQILGEVDFDNITSIEKSLNSISLEMKEQYSDKIDCLLNLSRVKSLQFDISKVMTIITMFIASGLLKDTPFKLVNNELVCNNKEDIVRQYISKLIRTAFKIVSNSN